MEASPGYLRSCQGRGGEREWDLGILNELTRSHTDRKGPEVKPYLTNSCVVPYLRRSQFLTDTSSALLTGENKQKVCSCYKVLSHDFW